MVVNNNNITTFWGVAKCSLVYIRVFKSWAEFGVCVFRRM